MSSKMNVQEWIKPIINPRGEVANQNIEWNQYLKWKRSAYGGMNQKEIEAHLISEANWMVRNHAKSCEEFRVRIHVGDICYIDFGPAYLNEAGFQHFGLILSMMNSKAFVVPMTSNPTTYGQAYDPIEFPYGKKHLMKLGLIPGMRKESVLFLNDCKYINTARIIDVKAHIDETDVLFIAIQKRVMDCLMGQLT